MIRMISVEWFRSNHFYYKGWKFIRLSKKEQVYWRDSFTREMRWLTDDTKCMLYDRITIIIINDSLTNWILFVLIKKFLIKKKNIW